MHELLKRAKDVAIRSGKMILTFYTFWAMIFHVLYFIDVLPNTRPIAFIVLVGSQIMNFVYPNYRKKYPRWSYKMYLFELVFHILPVIIVPYSMALESVLFCVATLGIYLLYHGSNIAGIYENNRQTMKDIWKGVV